MTSEASPVSPGALLRRPPTGGVEAGGHLGGFGGFHGGLTLGLMTTSMQAEAPDLPLRSATARFHRQLTGEFQVHASTVRSGRKVTAVSAEVTGVNGVHVTGSGVFGSLGEEAWPAIAPRPPAAPPPEDCEPFVVSPDFVPISDYTEIRPVGPNRPYAGCAEPELTAWIRMLEDDEPPDVHRFVFLIDALAPSYAAILKTLDFVPTIEMTVRPSLNLARTSSPWILLLARTTTADAYGWTDERIDAWGQDGEHLGCAHQLRMTTPMAAS